MLKQLFSLLLFVCLLTSCSEFQKASMENTSQDDRVKILRLDKYEAEAVASGSQVALQEMVMLSPEASKILFEDVLRIGSVTDARLDEKFLNFFKSNKDRLQLVSDVEDYFGDLNGLAKSLMNAFGRLQKEQPTVPMPSFYTQISGFNQSVVVGDSILGISLDKYLGADYEPYKRYFYEGQIRQMDRRRITSDCIQVWLESLYPLPSGSNVTLLEAMIHFGKLNWVTRKIMDENYWEIFFDNSTEEQQKWKKNWPSLSKKLLSSDMLANRDEQFVRRIMLGIPDHKLQPEKDLWGTGMIASVYIVDQFMKKHPQYTISWLLDTTDYVRILEESGAKPA